MMWYDYRCTECGVSEERQAWKGVEPLCPACGAVMTRLPHYHTLSLRVPLNFHTDIRDVLGEPDEVKRQVRSGEIIPVGKGSRWV